MTYDDDDDSPPSDFDRLSNHLRHISAQLSDATKLLKWIYYGLWSLGVILIFKL